MGESRKSKTTEDVHQNGERLSAQERADRVVEELTRLARIPEENPDPVVRISA